MQKLILSSVVLLLVGVMAEGEKPQYKIDDGPKLFEKYIKDYNKEYKDEAEKELRYQAFLETLKEVIEGNEKSTDPEQIYEINKYADLTAEEKIARIDNPTID